MFISISDKPILAGLLAFFLVLFFLCIIWILFEVIRKMLNRMGKGKSEAHAQNTIEAKIYELIYSKEMSFNELLEYGLADEETLSKYLSDMIEKEIIVFENNTYKIKR